MADLPPWVIDKADGCDVLVHVSPGVRARPGIAGLHGDALGVRIGARPVDGAANAELLQMLGRLLGVPRRDLAVRQGASGRSKRIAVTGLDAATVYTRLAPLLRVDKAQGRS